MCARLCAWARGLACSRAGGWRWQPIRRSSVTPGPKRRWRFWVVWIEVSMRPDLVNDLIQLTGEHMVLVLSAMAAAMLIGVPLGILLTRREGLRRWLLGF